MTDPSRPWWADAVFYQVYPRSFQDSNGDGVGDLDGVSARLGYLKALGVDALWLNPVMVSPMADNGYDVADPRDIDPLFGDLAAMDRLTAAAHDLGMKVTMDLVPNHTSSAHPWFQAALAAGPGSTQRRRYIFRDGAGADGAEPPNNWLSIFGGPAWTRVTEADGRPGQWYLHLFDVEQPDLNWENPEVFDDLERTLRFWLDRGVDGFRIDVAHGMAKPRDLPDMPIVKPEMLLAEMDDDPRFNDDGVHEIHRRIRRVFDDYPDAVAIGEVWVYDNEQFARYVRPDELHLGFNFRLVRAGFDAADIRDAIENSMAAVELVGATPTWTLANHDVEREPTRYGGGPVGLARAKAMALVMLALPGAVFVYNGEELGLPNADLPDEALRDPVWERSGHTRRGRDGSRVPMPWQGDAPPFGFSDTADTWLPIPPEWSALTVEKQLADPSSTLTFFRRAIEFRCQRSEFDGPTVEMLDSPAGSVVFHASGGLVCVLNAGDGAIPLPEGEVLLASGDVVDGALPPDTAAWLV
ncbi:glycoside hydrolase family 13 protein [Mycolicibacterium flavescens]|uniref:Alpha-amylase n=1 Tax=Mycolicibacterium flavescens TaxID=1776 RepID=A0A1E3RN32_MYCFV|nr:glycoside hydrolase family 13 protein [Mycolicibacterium flavescens]MCV7281199.1 glycoside hydrolase family 13 protein [Mycolicibacterium flavescens]ODQ91269.1 alpha-amylase [Mycolicibacterium flavescens]